MPTCPSGGRSRDDRRPGGHRSQGAGVRRWSPRRVHHRLHGDALQEPRRPGRGSADLMTADTASPTAAGGRAAGVGSSRPSSPAERAAAGREARRKTPRSSHAGVEPSARSRRPGRAARAAGRDPRARARADPVRADARRRRSPSSAGAALIMAGRSRGRAREPDLDVQLCGDAHLSNFGVFASARAAARVRHQRLRRDAARPLGVGREAARREPRWSPAGTNGFTRRTASDVVRATVRVRTAARCATSPRCATSTSGTRGSTIDDAGASSPSLLTQADGKRDARTRARTRRGRATASRRSRS